MTHAPETRRCSTVSVSSAPAPTLSQLHIHPMRGFCSRRSTRDPKALARVLNDARALVSNPPFGRALPIAKNMVELVHADRVEMAALLLPGPWEAASTPRRVALTRAMALRIVCCWRPPGSKEPLAAASSITSGMSGARRRRS
jgi:hypothetical protein